MLKTAPTSQIEGAVFDKEKEGDFMATKKPVQSGSEAENKNSKSPTDKTAEKKSTAALANTKKNGREANIIRDSETAKKRGRNGGIKSGEVRRAKRDARETIRYMLGRLTTSAKIRENLKELGFETEEFSNMAALQGRLFSMAMSGNLEAYMLLMKMGGYEPEENRKERESLSSGIRRDAELKAKIDALGGNVDDASIGINMSNEDGNNDVIIYMPQIASEEECQVKNENDKTEDGSDSKE